LNGQQLQWLFARICIWDLFGVKVQHSETMSEQNRVREREHWQAIAEQLGLAPESAESESEQVPEKAPAALKSEAKVAAPADASARDLPTKEPDRSPEQAER